MKIFQKSILLLLSVFAMNSSNAQTVYGTYNPSTGQATVTASLASIATELKAELNDPGVQISDIQFVPLEPNSGKFLLAGSVTGSSVGITAVGFHTILSTGNTIVLELGGPAPTGGPKTTETCSGDPCGRCHFVAGGGCACSGSGRCNHSISH